MTTIGTPGPGAVTASAPIACSHHSVGVSPAAAAAVARAHNAATATPSSTSPACAFRTLACTSARSSSARSPSSLRAWKSLERGRSRLSSPGYTEARMSHLDDLDEYEADLELQLKKEYQAVFSLFRYCVLTQDATYLCNKLERTYVPQQTYPFFHLKLEDVWVWDKNRPTRIIPRTEIFTSGDVTIEELRGEGDEPALTPEALAERIGETQPHEEDF